MANIDKELVKKFYNNECSFEEKVKLFRQILENKPSSYYLKPRLIFDVDGTICRESDDEGNLYPKEKPYADRPPYPFAVKTINELYNDGYKITLFTSRYMHRFNKLTFMERADMLKSAISELETWCEKWGIKYDEIKFGKPSGDLYIDNHGYRLESEKGEVEWGKFKEFLQDFRPIDYENVGKDAKLPLQV